MHDLFPGHYRPSEESLKKLWGNATVVFDTNVLLSLYSYPEQARNDFFSVLEKIEMRIWIPYQVAFEFHKNRFSRIRGSNESVEKLQQKLKRVITDLKNDFDKIEFEKRNTGIFNLNDRITAAAQAFKSLENAIDLACEKLPRVSLDDPIGEKIAQLFLGKVGPRPTNQTELDALIVDGDKRYTSDTPPGYKDKNKGDKYIDGDVTYEAKFGDLILWNQTIEHIKSISKKDVIFVTGDRKEDWWWIEKGEILGPEPKLISEFLNKSEASNFWMYTIDKFLEFASSFLDGVNISNDTIDQVKHTSDQQQLAEQDSVRIDSSRVDNSHEDIIRALRAAKYAKSGFREDYLTPQNLSGSTYVALRDWVEKNNPDFKVQLGADADFVVLDNEEPIAMYEVILPRKISAKSIINKIISIKRRTIQNYILLIVIDEDMIHEFEHLMHGGLGDIQGMLDFSGVTGITFGFIINERFSALCDLTADRQYNHANFIPKYIKY